MAKYIEQSGGALQEVQPVNSSAGSADAAKMIQLDSNGKLDVTMMPTGIAPDTASIAASENLSASDLVNVYNNGGTVGVRKADAATPGREANGFVLAAVTSGANAQVYFEGPVTGLTGLTGGAVYFLSDTTPGSVTSTVTTTSGSIVQRIGRAIGTTSINFEPQEAIKLV